MIQTIRNAWAVPELRKKILFTIFALLIFRLGSAIPVPYINNGALEIHLQSQSGTILGLMNAMSGSAFAMATIFALSIQPYINSSIIIQLLTVAIPALERLAKEGGEEGRKKIASITRYTTVAIALLQGFGYYSLIKSYGLVETGGMNAVWVGVVIVLSFTAGSAFLMWLGEQITEFGIGNGISILLFAGIVSRFPTMVTDSINGVGLWSKVQNGTVTAQTILDGNPTAYKTLEEAQNYLDKAALAPWMIPLILVGMLLLVVFIVYISNAERRLPVQYAKRVVGRKMYGGQSTHIPMKVNMSGVMPIIFAQSIASLPATIGAFAGWTVESEGFGGGLMRLFDTTKPFYSILYFILIVGFSYFYATMQFNPIEVSNNLKKNGGFIPGFRPGKPTADFIAKVLSKITMFGALYLSVVAIAPIITGNIVGYHSLAIGGTSVIIVVGVALETVKQMEAQMLMRHYKGFLE
ncbi:MAG: preprotein translocase subunit SecY [Lawsonibacter sp.]|jgi:preprotein translocase subunit SecY